MSKDVEKKLILAVTWWWTGWHITPIVSLLEYGHKHINLADKCNHIYWFGEGGKYEQDACAWLWLPYLSFIGVKAWKLRRYWTWRSTLLNIRDFFLVLVWFFQSLRYLKAKKVDVLFCKGWYVALPVSFAARCLWIPVHVHESDTHAWLANKLIAKFAKRVYTWFPGSLPHEEVVWQLLSPMFVEENDQSHLSITPTDKTTVLVICGSQWSAVVLQALLAVFDRKWQTVKNMQWYVILGKRNREYRHMFEEFENVQTFDFLSPADLSVVYLVCDLAITRGSATTLAELQHFWCKKIIVPLPFTWWNHQEYNADWYVETHWDVKVLQNDDMVWQLERSLLKYQWYKKKAPEASKDAYYLAHKTILNNMFW